VKKGEKHENVEQDGKYESVEEMGNMKLWKK